MNRPLTSSRILLLAGRRTAPHAGHGAVRRYRLVRMQPDGRPAESRSGLVDSKRP